jgi:hypothetical protein
MVPGRCRRQRGLAYLIGRGWHRFLNRCDEVRIPTWLISRRWRACGISSWATPRSRPPGLLRGERPFTGRAFTALDVRRFRPSNALASRGLNV